MTSMLRPLHELIIQLLSFEERIEPYKMTSKQVVQIFGWLDHRRRGYVDVSDFYAKFSELSENELFYIFKFMDVGRKGAFTQNDLQAVLCSKSTRNGDAQDDSIRSFTNLVRVLKATFYLIEEHKRKLALTPVAMEQIFSKATMNKKDNIDMTDLVILFKEAGLEVNEKFVMYLKGNVFVRSALDLKEWKQACGLFVRHQDGTGTKEQTGKEQSRDYKTGKIAEKVRNTDKITSEIDKIMLKYRHGGAEFASVPEKRSQADYLPYRPTITEAFSPSQWGGFEKFSNEYQKDPYETRLQELKLKSTFKEPETYLRRHTDLDSGKIDQLLNFNPASFAQGSSQINKRREELRKGSLERQRIIDDVVNKKRMELSNKPGMLYSPSNLRIVTREQEVEQRVSNTCQNYRPSTPSSKASVERTNNFEGTLIGKLYERPLMERESYSRPASASKTCSSFFEKTQPSKYDQKPDLLQFYRKGTETPKSYTYEKEKENILRKAEQEATRKIEQIERRARLKVMEKRSATGVYNRWLK